MNNIVVPFHSGDQYSAQLLLENMIAFDSGMGEALSIRLQFDRPKEHCHILDTIERLSRIFSVEFLQDLPTVPVPEAFRTHDPNGQRVDELHTVRTPETKERILSWNRAVYHAIHTLDRFAIIEPDCIILKDGWARDIFEAAKAGLEHFPIFGHLKTGLIGGHKVPTHYAGCSVYDGIALRQLITDEVFQTRYPNPWWPLRHNKPTELAGNCYWGPLFSGYDISFDYFLYGHLQRDRHGHDHPLEWTVSDLPDGSNVILCDFHSRKTIDEIFSHYYGKQPVIHGIKDDAVRHAIIKRARRGLTYPGYALSGAKLEAPYKRDVQALRVQAPSQPSGVIGKYNDRFCTINNLQDKFKGERCFLIANGPSLKRTDLTRLKDEYTIGLNRIGLNLDNMGFEPTFLCCVNANVLEQFADDFERSSSIKFLSKKAESEARNTWNTFFMGSIPKVGYFEKDLRSQDWCEGWTVTYCAMQVAYFLGFKEVVLVGLDHYFKDSGAANKAVVAGGNDQNHFHPAYFGKGVVWQYPDLDRSEQHYVVARQTFEADGRRILDATLDGHCTIFEKVDFDSLFPKQTISSTPPKPKLSVIIPFWNEERYIEEAIQSILNETLESIEIVCVDDNSTDMSPAIVRNMAEIHPEVRIVSNSGKGVSDARNTGLAFSRGEYIAFLDADDIVTNQSLKTRLQALDNNPDWPMVHGTVNFTDYSGKYLGGGMGLQRTVTFADAHGMPAHFNTVMLRRSVVHDLSFPSNLTNGEDWLAFARFLRHGHSSHFVKTKGGAATYRIHPKSTVLQDYTKHEKGAQSVLNWIFTPVGEDESTDEFRLGLEPSRLPGIRARRTASLLFWHILKGDVEGSKNIALELIESGQASHLNWPELAPSLKVSGIRAFSIHADELMKLEKERLQSISAPLSAAANILGGELYVPFCQVFGLEPEPFAPLEFPRDKGAGVDETEVVAHLLKDSIGRQHIMLDVGAHYGTSAQFFHNLDWSIHCFEPDPKNREKLLARFKDADNVLIDTRAVSDNPAKGVQFFTSEQSTGISGLHAFHQSHSETGRVDVTTLYNIIADRQIAKVDFLKIDVEGFDLNVLKGVPWDKLKPDVIECEFEDAKTLKLGHDTKVIANYLTERGYTVYVSEWHPIIRYGIPHDWRRVFRYEGQEIPGDAWGNLLAFRYDPGIVAVTEAFKAVMSFRQKKQPAIPAPAAALSPIPALTAVKSAPADKRLPQSAVTKLFESSSTGAINQYATNAGANKTEANYQASRVNMLKQTPDNELRRGTSPDPAKVSPGNVWYSSFAHQIQAISPSLFELLRFFRRSALHVVRRPLLLLPLIAVMALFAWIGTAPSLEPIRPWLLTTTSGAVLLALLVYVAHRAYFHAEQLHLKSQKLQSEIAALQQRLSSTQTLISRGPQQATIEYVRDTLASAITPQFEALSSAVSTLEKKASTEAASFVTSLDTLKNKHESRLNDLSRAIDQVRAVGISQFDEVSGRFTKMLDQLNSDILGQIAREASTSQTFSSNLANRFEIALTGVRQDIEALQDKARSGEQSQAELHTAMATAETLGTQLEAAVATIREEVSALEDRTLSGQKQLETSLTALNELSKLANEVRNLSERLENTGARISVTDKWAQFDNTRWFQHFNRRLSDQHIQTLETEWGKRLSLPISKQVLGYMASRACDIERRLDGRLATSVEDILLRTLIARAVKGKTLDVLEIGTLFATGAAIMYDSAAPHFEKIHFTLLDPLEGYYNSAQADILTGQIVNEAAVRRNLARVGMSEGEYTLIKNLSTAPEAIEAAGKKSYDVLVIDGDHSYAGVKADFENYASMVKLGGYIILDDYNSPDWPDVTDYVDKELVGHDLVSAVGASWRTCVYRVVKAPAKSGRTTTIISPD